MDTTVDTRWYVFEGTEECPLCLARYAVEVEVRCHECDGPACPHCVVRVTGHLEHVRCAACVESTEA